MRRRAETRLAERAGAHLASIASVDFERLVHKLGVHQIELEMQNEELLRLQSALEGSRDRYQSLYEQAPVGYLTTGLDGLIVEANQLAGEMLGLSTAQLLRGRLTDYFMAGDRLRFRQGCGRLMRDGEPQALQLRLVPARGVPRRVAVRIGMVRDGLQQRQYRIALLDDTERVLLQEDNARLAAIVASSDDAIIGRDLDGRVASWNRGAERVFGFSAAQMVGQALDVILPPERRAEDADLLQRLSQGERIPPFESERLHRSGRLVPLLMSLSATSDDGGQVIGSSLIGRDISERKRAERMLHKRLRQLDVLSQAGLALITAEPGATPMQHVLFDRVRVAVGGEIYLNYSTDGDAGTLRLVSGHGLSEARRAVLEVVPMAGSLCGIAASGRTPLIVENLQASNLAEAKILQAEGVRAYAGFPLLAHGDVHGVAAFASTTHDRFRADDLQVMQTVCDQVSAMLERAELLAQLHARELSLQLADRRKDDFIATLAHELRNPLAPILNAVGILRRSSLADPKLTWCRDVIERQVTQMTHLLEDLLDVSRITRNKIELRRERIEVRQVIDAHRHQLTLDLPAAPIVLYGDLMRLTQVLGNLLSNAVKYTDTGGQITVTVRHDADNVSIAVRDNGIGIEPQQVPRVFDMFAQLKPALERSRGGLGIGLSLSRGLIELHGGRIEARSGGHGQGSEFVMRLPIVDQTGGKALDSTATPVHAPAAAVGRRVLVIDDNADAAHTLAMMLTLHGLETRLAFGGREGLRVAEEWRPDAAVVDIGMPQLNGYELCRRIREHPWGEQVLMIACTGWGQVEDKERARAAGFDVHLVKPIDPDEVLQALFGRTRHDEPSA
jgi:PAS domain S-box-containing protein